MPLSKSSFLLWRRLSLRNATKMMQRVIIGFIVSTSSQSFTTRLSNLHTGIIRSSPFLSLHKFDMIEGFPYDYMHGALLGVVKHLTGLLFDSTQDMEYNVSGRGRSLPKQN